MANFILTINYCDKTTRFSGSYDNGGSSTSCLPNGNAYTVNAASQNFTVNVMCGIKSVTSTLSNTFTNAGITFTIPLNTGASRSFNATIEWVDGTTNNIYITQNARYSRYVNIPIEQEYICEDGDKKYKQKRQYSYDNTNWFDAVPPQYRTGATYETGSSDCSDVTVYDKWIEDGYACSGYNKYISETHVYSTDGEIFFPEYPPETRLGALVEENSEYCGYELKTQWRDDGDEGCYGTTLRHVLVKYVSEDMGVTWTKADPEETQPGDIIRTGATECGWIEWDELKYYGIYDNDYEDAYTVQDDGVTVITTADTKPVSRDITHLTKAVVGSGVTTIGGYCFSNASSLTDVTIHNVTVVEASAFANCSSLTSFTTNTVQTIGQNAFRGCTGLETVTFSQSVTSIAPYAFYDCTGLQALYFNSATPPTLGQNALANTGNCPIYVYYANLSTYQAAWPDLASRLVGRIPPPSSDDMM